MPTLPGHVCAYIVAALACYETPEQVATAVKQKFGLVLTRQRIEAWHPERRAGVRLGAHWRELFYDTRRKLLAEVENIPIACRSYRLKVLQRVAEQAEAASNLPLAMQVMAQAAREVGAERC
ncbi:DUF2280 domain-containing protein [Pseudoduganella violacea]|uniref:DUF2280 domain-containing protein n=1 Tax=Pseudoduganella violacea TaxID=1715466 RepID=A0A7W5B8H6_9BURK|nr:DUF2280 domain-containing protein [Pseudoduganella violacea]MBB3118368.1 hypothetical protein [Pseudoduganella violacea]